MNEYEQPTTAVDPVAGESTEDRQGQLERWFHECYEDISAEVDRHARIDHSEAVMVRLVAAFPQCRAKSKAQFLSWVSPQARKCAEEYSNDTQHLNDIVNLQEVLAAPKSERKNTRPLIYEQHGDKVFIELSYLGKPLVWIIPAEWFPVAKRLWPVHVRLFPQSGPYVAKKVPRLRPDGRREQVIVPLHRLFVDCGGQSLSGDHSAQTVLARNGNYLDWTNGNLGPLIPLTSRDLTDVSYSSDRDINTIHDPNWFRPPDKPKRTPPNQDPRNEGKGHMRSQFWSKSKKTKKERDQEYIDLMFPS